MKILEAIQDPNSELALLLDSLYDAVYIVDRERVILYWNHAAEQITGFSAAEVLGHSCKDGILNHIDENGKLLCYEGCPLLYAMETAGNTSAKVYPCHKQGHRFPVETHVTSILDEEGTAVAAIEVFRDITHQEEFRIMQEKFNGLIRKYVSSVTFDEVREQAKGKAGSRASRIVDLTVLYLDVVNFTGFSERNDSSAVMEMLNELFGICDVITRECLGDIDKFIGDAIMAIFNDANDAVRASVKILQEALPQMNQSRQQRGLQEISVRIGINSGLVMQGEVGTLDRRDLTVIGDAVNIAARVEKSSLPNRLMISEASYARLKADLRPKFEFHHEEQLRGKNASVRLYLLQ